MLAKCKLDPRVRGENPVLGLELKEQRLRRARNRLKERHVTNKTAENEPCLNIDSLKSTLGIDSILTSISCLSESVKKLTNVGQCMAGSSSNNENAMEQNCSCNQPSATITIPSVLIRTMQMIMQ